MAGVADVWRNAASGNWIRDCGKDIRFEKID
jgi:hypothetical protein